MAFRIRAEQMAEFERAGMAAFEDEMVAHSKEFSPRLCKVLGDDQLRVALRQAIKRAQSYGFTNRGPIRLYIELMFLCGSDFDTDPQYPDIRTVLTENSDQMLRADRIHQGVVNYVDTVAGEKNINVRKAEAFLAEFARTEIKLSKDEFDSMLVTEITRAFPEKAAWVGSESLNRLIQEGRAESLHYGLESLRAQAMIVILKFSFGHGCTKDPLYPWIHRTLTDEKIVDSEARAKRLEKKAITWLDHVLARNQQGAST